VNCACVGLAAIFTAYGEVSVYKGSECSYAVLWTNYLSKRVLKSNFTIFQFSSYGSRVMSLCLEVSSDLLFDDFGHFTCRFGCQ